MLETGMRSTIMGDAGGAGLFLQSVHARGSPKLTFPLCWIYNRELS